MMLHAGLSLLTLTSIIAHAMLGCCWHHGHADGMVHGATVDADHPQETHGACGHRSTEARTPDDRGVPRHDPGESPDCQGIDCVYLAAPQPATVEAGAGPPTALIAEQTLAATRRVASSTAEDSAPDPPLEAGMLRALRQEWQV